MNLRSLERLKTEGGLRRAERNEFLLHFPTATRVEQWPHHRYRSLAALEPAGPRHGFAGAVHPGCRGDGLIISDRGMGHRRHLPPIAHVAGRRTGTGQGGGQPVTRQFSQNLPRTVMGYLQRYQVPPDLLELEITESMLMHNADSVVLR